MVILNMIINITGRTWITRITRIQGATRWTRTRWRKGTERSISRRVSRDKGYKGKETEVKGVRLGGLNIGRRVSRDKGYKGKGKGEVGGSGQGVSIGRRVSRDKGYKGKEGEVRSASAEECHGTEGTKVKKGRSRGQVRESASA